MRDYRRTDAFYPLEQLAGEIYVAVQKLPAHLQVVMGRDMQQISNSAAVSILQGCSTRNALTFLPYVEKAHGDCQGLGHYLRLIKKFKLLPDDVVNFLMNRQSSCSAQLMRLFQRIAHDAGRYADGELMSDDIEFGDEASGLVAESTPAEEAAKEAGQKQVHEHAKKTKGGEANERRLHGAGRKGEGER